MASLGDVGEVLRRVLVKIDQAIAAHHEAADLAEQARDLLSLAGTGTLQADVAQACALFTRVTEGISEPEGQVSTLATVADEIRSSLRTQGMDDSAAATNVICPPHQKTGSPAHIEAVRDQLPPPVQRATGQKTHGRWFAAGSDEVKAVVSGEDEDSAEAWRLLRETRFPGAGPPIAITHAELKVVARMRRGGHPACDFDHQLSSVREAAGL